MAGTASTGADEKLYTILELAALWGLSRDQIERLMHRGELEWIKVGERRRIPASSVAAYKARHRG